MKKPIASLSLDLDDKWSYLRTLGVAGWEKYPSYLDVVVPRMLRFCNERGLRITCFIVGHDAQRRENRDLLAAIADSGHEIGNHSQNHYPWMHRMPRAQVETEIDEAEECIEHATGQRPIGFRGPGFSLSQDSLESIARRGYLYDATSWPTYIGPLARWYVRRKSSVEASGKAKQQFGPWSDGLQTLKPYLWKSAIGSVVEIPVTTFPIVKCPIHMTYLLYLWQFSPRLTKTYIKMALTACRWSGVEPSILLHPLDFLGKEDEADLICLPGMNLPRDEKQELMSEMLADLAARFEIVSMEEHAHAVRRRLGLTPYERPAPKQVAEPLVAESTQSQTAELIV